MGTLTLTVRKWWKVGTAVRKARELADAAQKNVVVACGKLFVAFEVPPGADAQEIELRYAEEQRVLGYDPRYIYHPRSTA